MCGFLHDYIVIPTSQGISDKIINFIYLCPPQYPVLTSSVGYGSRSIKFIVTTPANFSPDQGTLSAYLQILDITTIPPTNVHIPVEIGYYFDLYSNKLLPTVQNISCMPTS